VTPRRFCQWPLCASCSAGAGIPQVLHSIRSRQQGVTLVELVISIVILGIALVAIVSAISTSVSRGSNVLLQSRMIELSQAYMDEILGKRFDEDTPIGGFPPVTSCNISTEEASRAEYDDVDDYDAIANEAPTSQTSSDFSDYTGYEVTVTVSCGGVDIGVTNTRAKRITLLISDPQGQSMTFTAYKGNY